MNHEMIMLKGMAKSKRLAKALRKESLSLALSSYSNKSGTYGQMLNLAKLAIKIENYEAFCALTVEALAQLTRGNKALLVAVYLKGTSKEEIAAKYNVSLSTVYRKLASARATLRKQLEKMGCTEQWFVDTFGEERWVQKMLHEHPHRDES